MGYFVHRYKTGGVNERVAAHIAIFLSTLEKEVNNKTWDTMGVRTFSGVPDGITTLRGFYVKENRKGISDFDLFDKIHDYLWDKVTKYNIDHGISITIGYKGYGRRDPETQLFYDNTFNVTKEIIDFDRLLAGRLDTPDTFHNTCEESNITCVQIIDGFIHIFYKNKSIVTVNKEQIFYFLNQQKKPNNPEEYFLSNNIVAELKLTFAREIQHRENNPLPKLSIDDCLDEYIKMFSLIAEYKNKSNDPLLIIISEQHFSGHCLLFELIAFFIAMQYGLENALIEFHEEFPDLPKIKDLIDGVRYRAAYFMHAAKKNGASIVPMETNKNLRDNACQIDSEVRKKYSSLEYIEYRIQSSKNPEWTRKYHEKELSELLQSLAAFDKTTADSLDRRDEVMCETKNHLLSGTSRFEIPDEKIKVSVVGSNHLQQILKILSQQKKYNVLPISCIASDYSPDLFSNATRADIFPYTSKRSIFFQTDPNIHKVTIKKDCEFYTCDELYFMVMEVHQIFCNAQAQLLNDDMADLRAHLIAHKEQAHLCAQLNEKLEKITASELAPALKRYELRRCVRTVLDNKPQSQDENFYLDLQKLAIKMNDSAFQITNLNAQERKQLRMPLK